MKKIFFIIIILFSCDEFAPSEQEGGSTTYYDYLSYGWSKIFAKHFDCDDDDERCAQSFFDESLDVDITYYNSAMVGMGWVMTYLANSDLNSETCNNQSDCTSIVDESRNKAKCFFYRSTLDDQDELKSKTFDQILQWCENININVEYANADIINIELPAIVEFYENECELVNGIVENSNCYENFVLDLKVGHLYLEYLSYQSAIIDEEQVCDDVIDENGGTDNCITLGCSELADEIDCNMDDGCEWMAEMCVESADGCNNTCDELDTILKLFKDFWTLNPLYDITKDKATYSNSYDINHKKIEARISQFYLDSGIDTKIQESCDWAKKICTSLECETVNPIDNVQYILDCIDSEL